MSNIDNNLLPDEQILFRTKKSLMIFTLPIVWTLFSVYATHFMLQNSMLITLVWAPWIIAIVWWLYYAVEYLCSDFVVTTKRVMMREGFFNRHSNELRLTTISQVNIDQSLAGQIFNYGVVSLNAFGAFDVYTTISRPLSFRKAINQQLDKLTTAR